MWSVEYVNAGVGQTLDFDHGRGVDAETGLSLRVAGQGAHESDAQTSRILLLAWGRVKLGDHDDIS